MATRQEEDILVAQLQKGERKEEAFSKLVTLYKERLYWHVRNMVKNHEDANDVLALIDEKTILLIWTWSL